ncbi:MAG: hypothetical protein ACYC6F_17250 [Longimicrobiales bacterium]
MSEPWPSKLAWELLEEAENDPRGHGYLDVEAILRAWGVTEPLPGQEDVGYRALRHPGAPNLPFRFPERQSLHAETILYVCRGLRKLYEALK